ncbi:SIRT2 [Lepeophtheirus salmonis]|uniref:SIRT2 n=1 Tax=Lepeophtheirus salmonis TaxID=72036 RepID=A0A7R8D8M8_LEPSM|nr:SIRT2 [Lepeophtheirus salmonis]CAF3036565.1 SIRT2 [Lepeophtheirus salmonis]
MIPNTAADPPPRMSEIILICSGTTMKLMDTSPIDFWTWGVNHYYPEQILDEVSFSGIVRFIASGKARRIITMLAKDLLKSQNYSPTPCHYFIKLLESKGLLLRHYTQNIDCLERKAGVSQDLLVEAHGSFASSTCQLCGREGCGGVVKPDIVFFGESLPGRFFQSVQPFASLVNQVQDTTPRLLINMQVVGDEGANDFVMRLMGRGGMDFTSDRRYRDVAEIGTCDDGCKKLAEALGWKEELESLMNK